MIQIPLSELDVLGMDISVLLLHLVDLFLRRKSGHQRVAGALAHARCGVLMEGVGTIPLEGWKRGPHSEVTPARSQFGAHLSLEPRRGDLPCMRLNLRCARHASKSG